jgi:hypothetical protein
MSTIAEFTLPAESFPLGSVFENHLAVTVELERIVPTTKAIIPYVWLRGIGDVEEQEIEATFGEHPEVQSVQLIDEVSGDYLLRVEWDMAYTGILQAIAQTPVVLHSGIGDSEQWTFEIRGDEQESIATFQKYCREHDLPIQLTSLHSLARVATGAEYDLTDTQREALVLAFQRGYYQKPQETTLQEMADDLGITGQALGARLRGGTHHLIGSTLIQTHENS